MNELMNAMDAVKRDCPPQLMTQVMRLGDEVNRVVNEMAQLRNELDQLRAQVNAGNCPKCGGRMADHFEWEGRMRCPVQNFARHKR